jgi:tetratricopeptide (TPR) repeat protein
VLLALVHVTHPQAAPPAEIVRATPTPAKCEGAVYVADALYRAGAYETGGNFDQAIALYTCALRFDPRSVWAYESRAWAYWRHHDFQEAIADFSAAIRYEPGSFSPYHNRGQVYFMAGDVRRALADYQRTVILDHTNIGAHNDLALAYSMLGEHVRAFNVATRAMELDPDGFYAYWLRGDVYVALGKYEQALADYEQALALIPDSPMVHDRLASTYHLLARRYDVPGSEYEALRYYKRYLEYAGDSPFLSARVRVWTLAAHVLMNNRISEV